jgi:predicted Zn-dependent protease
MMRPSIVRGVLSAVLFTLIAGCSTVPYTGRTRIILMSESRERAMGERAYEEILAKGPIANDERAALVRKVGEKIAAVAAPDCPDYDWQFVLIDDPKTVNAFCLPGGKVAFYSGILPICQDETGIAVVMGHEVAHALARHGAERMSQQTVLNAGAVAIGVAAGKSTGEQVAIAAGTAAAFKVAFALPFSRKHESEADYIGLMLMAQAGYDPRQAPDFWARMQALGGAKGPDWLSTHPPDEKRKEDLEDAMGDAMEFYDASGKNKSPHNVQSISAGG